MDSAARLSNETRPIGTKKFKASNATSTPPTTHGRVMVFFATMALATSAIESTDAIATEATTQVEPHNSANWIIDLVSSSMKPAPSRKNCHDHRPASPPAPEPRK